MWITNGHYFDLFGFANCYSQLLLGERVDFGNAEYVIGKLAIDAVNLFQLLYLLLLAS